MVITLTILQRIAVSTMTIDCSGTFYSLHVPTTVQPRAVAALLKLIDGPVEHGRPLGSSRWVSQYERWAEALTSVALTGHR